MPVDLPPDPDRSFRFAGRTALVTGGGKGIGRGIALRLAREGADVAITYFRDRASAERSADEMRSHGVRVAVLAAFLGGERSAIDLVEATRAAMGEPDLLVSNAGSGVERPLAEIKRVHWDWAMNAHAHSFLQLVQQLPKLRSVLAVSSLGSARVLPWMYGMLGVSKAAMEALVRYLAAEHGQRCRVNAITPGLVLTESVKRFRAIDEMVRRTLEETPARRLVTPEDVAAVAAFLLSDEAAMINGHNVVVDGGYSLML